MEWCEETIPFGECLKKTYEKFGQKLSLIEHRRLFSDTPKENVEKRLLIYNKVCEKVKPIFQNFFFEKFPVPGIWFERRLSYIHR